MKTTMHYVYELIAANGNHLYVGCTSNIAQRLGQHQSQRKWWPEVFRTEVDTFPNQREALDAERERIELYQPIHNVVHTDRFNAGGWDTRRARIAAAHEAGENCGDITCHPCKDLAHGQGITCGAHFSGCTVCRDYIPSWTLVDASDIHPIIRASRRTA